MSTGVCVRCGEVGPVELDHPDGRHNGKPLLPKVVVALCKSCHLAKGRFDRAAGVEAGAPTLGLLIARRAGWLVFMASYGEPVVFPSQVLADFGWFLGAVARLIPADLPWEADS
jgi:hypothetical protein